MIKIGDEHIKEAEELLVKGESFDIKERIPFIKTFYSCDLLSVPGSGKTTALLAKLFCLAKHLPLKHGGGILVLSHTNAAVNEIKRKLQKVAPRLFEYPNFIGTVQSFINKFMANPACYLKYNSYIHHNDNDIYEREANTFFYSLQWKKTEPKGLKNKLYGRINIGKNDLSFPEKEENVRAFLKYFELDVYNRKSLYNGKSFYTYNGKSKDYYLELEKWKAELFSEGILNYKDSYSLANWYIKNYPYVVTLLQNRFRYVFIDEMQDLEKYQISIIDDIFYNECSPTILQRIGDINQSIYNSGKKVKTSADWIAREPIMYLNDSRRLTKEVSNIVNLFTLDRQKDENGNPRFVVQGTRKLDKCIKPHLILFNHKTKGQLSAKFADIIKQYGLEKTPEGKKYGFKIIGWNAKWDDNEDHDGKLRLEDIFDGYKKENATVKNYHDSLSKFLLYFDKSKNTLGDARRAILNVLLQILRFEKKMCLANIRGTEKERYFTNHDLILLPAITNTQFLVNKSAEKMATIVHNFSFKNRL